jgi:hypothetical protein
MTCFNPLRSPPVVVPSSEIVDFAYLSFALAVMLWDHFLIRIVKFYDGFDLVEFSSQ